MIDEQAELWRKGGPVPAGLWAVAPDDEDEADEDLDEDDEDDDEDEEDGEFDEDDEVDEQGEESFPASDPPAR